MFSHNFIEILAYHKLFVTFITKKMKRILLILVITIAFFVTTGLSAEQNKGNNGTSLVNCKYIPHFTRI